MSSVHGREEIAYYMNQDEQLIKISILTTSVII